MIYEKLGGAWKMTINGKEDGTGVEYKASWVNTSEPKVTVMGEFEIYLDGFGNLRVFREGKLLETFNYENKGKKIKK